MKPRMIALSTLAILLVVAIGAAAVFVLQDDPEENHTTISPDNPEQYLLSLDDMPTGWSILPDEPEDDEGDDTTTFLCEERRTGAESFAERSLQKSATGPYILNNVSIWSDADAARQTFAEMKAIAGRCDTWTNEDDEEFSITPISAPEYGDESFAVRLTIGTAGEGSTIIMRKNNALAVVIVLELTVLGDSAPDGFLDDMAQTVLAKFD